MTPTASMPSMARWDEDRFQRVRRDVLAKWPTGAAIDLDEAAAWHKAMPETKNTAWRLRQARAQGTSLVQPRGGVAGIDEQIALLRRLRSAGADLLPTTVDSYTRECRYEDAERGLAQSREAGRSLLNGFPAVNYGVGPCRHIAESVDAPLFCRTAAPDCRLTHEVMYAGGYTSCTAGPIVFSLGYAKDYPLERAIECWQYSYRMMGAYRERGVTLSVEHYLPISTMVPHSTSMACVLLDSLIAAAQGVRDISLGIGQQCHLGQDAAALRALPVLGRHYLDAFGFGDVELSTVMSQWMGGFPSDEGQAFAVICMAATAGYLGGVTYMITKSPHEAAGVPTTEANAHGLSASKMVLRMLSDQKLAPIAEIAVEQAILEAETRAIVDRALELGDGDAAVGAVRAIEAGIIDVPFSPHCSNANQALPARDWRGAVRLAQFGAIPVPKEIREHHAAELARRTVGRPGREPWELLLADVNAISEGMLLPD
ncbi:MAG: methylaspartate mutase subunit E [Betaproteobacteria bacterium]|nr:methylaspartate mutase subunit E [Betaproteobacteria bacterium]